jgi:hypothetical protein
MLFRSIAQRWHPALAAAILAGAVQYPLAPKQRGQSVAFIGTFFSKFCQSGVYAVKIQKSQKFPVAVPIGNHFLQAYHLHLTPSTPFISILTSCPIFFQTQALFAISLYFFRRNRVLTFTPNSAPVFFTLLVSCAYVFSKLF